MDTYTDLTPDPEQEPSQDAYQEPLADTTEDTPAKTRRRGGFGRVLGIFAGTLGVVLALVLAYNGFRVGRYYQFACDLPIGADAAQVYEQMGEPDEVRYSETGKKQLIYSVALFIPNRFTVEVDGAGKVGRSQAQVAWSNKGLYHYAHHEGEEPLSVTAE